MFCIQYNYNLFYNPSLASNTDKANLTYAQRSEHAKFSSDV